MIGKGFSNASKRFALRVLQLIVFESLRSETTSYPHQVLPLQSSQSIGVAKPSSGFQGVGGILG